MFKKIVLWFVQSSENPSQMALTLKGIIITIIPWIITALGIFHVSVNSTDVANIGNSIITLVQATLTAVGAGIAVYGFIRKIINSGFIPWPTSTEAVSTVGMPTAVQ